MRHKGLQGGGAAAYDGRHRCLCTGQPAMTGNCEVKFLVFNFEKETSIRFKVRGSQGTHDGTNRELFPRPAPSWTDRVPG